MITAMIIRMAPSTIATVPDAVPPGLQADQNPATSRNAPDKLAMMPMIVSSMVAMRNAIDLIPSCTSSMISPVAELRR